MSEDTLYDLVCYELTTVEQEVEQEGGNIEVETFAAASGFDIQDANDPEYYPTMYKQGTSGATLEFTTDGEVEPAIVSGSTSNKPVRRPK